MTDTKPAREPGWYWVRGARFYIGTEWQVAEWHDGRWLLAGDDNDWLDDDFAEIDERRITRPAAPSFAEGAEAMREAAAVLCRQETTFWKHSHIQYKGHEMALKLANVIAALPLPEPKP